MPSFHLLVIHYCNRLQSFRLILYHYVYQLDPLHFVVISFSCIWTLILTYLSIVSDAPLVTIATFAPQLIVITSKQRPRKLTIHGSDGEDYAFLLKGHEDLRQDERVMQVNHISIHKIPVYHDNELIVIVHWAYMGRHPCHYRHFFACWSLRHFIGKSTC